MTFDNCMLKIKEELSKEEKYQDIPRLKRLFKSTQKERRIKITSSTEGLKAILEQYPLLSKMQFVSNIYI